MASANYVVVFDFDNSLIEVNSDPFIVENSSKQVTQFLKENIKKVQWTRLMDLCMEKLHEEGHTKEQLCEVLSRIQLDPNMREALELCHQNGATLYILSDANYVFIETILKTNKCEHLFKSILTNPGYFDEKGRLHIKPYHDFERELHGCPLCPANMCKGAIFESQISINHPKDTRYIYIGDGRGDFCPCTRISATGHVLARLDYPLHQLILSSETETSSSTQTDVQQHGLESAIVYNYYDPTRCFGRRVSAKVHPWETPSDVLDVFQTIFSSEN